MRLVILDKASFDCGDIDLSRLESLNLDIETYENTQPNKVKERVAQAEIIITNKVVLDSEIILEAKKLKLICISATGMNNVDLHAAEEHSIKVCNVTGYATSSVVQHVFMLITALNTNLNRYQAAIKQHRWSESDFFCLLDYPVSDLSTQTLGIIGYGELGKGVAKVARGFGMNVVIAESFEKSNGFTEHRMPLNELLNKSDIVSLHCPLTEKTNNMITRVEFSQMKPTALLINTARGGIVNEADLLVALKNKQIAGAGLDVLEQEPPTKDHALINSLMDNLIITPHIAWASQKSRQRLIDGVIQNIEEYLLAQA